MNEIEGFEEREILPRKGNYRIYKQSNEVEKILESPFELRDTNCYERLNVQGRPLYDL